MSVVARRATCWGWPHPAGTLRLMHTCREQLLHTLGNLTLVTAKLNPAMSNGPWHSKREDLLKYSRLALNAGLPQTWDDTAIIERGAMLAEVFLRRWPRMEGGSRHHKSADRSRSQMPTAGTSPPSRRRAGRRPPAATELNQAGSDAAAGQCRRSQRVVPAPVLSGRRRGHRVEESGLGKRRSDRGERCPRGNFRCRAVVREVQLSGP